MNIYWIDYHYRKFSKISKGELTKRAGRNLKFLYWPNLLVVCKMNAHDRSGNYPIYHDILLEMAKEVLEIPDENPVGAGDIRGTWDRVQQKTDTSKEFGFVGWESISLEIETPDEIYRQLIKTTELPDLTRRSRRMQ